jgi:periplasmic protein TonB
MDGFRDILDARESLRRPLIGSLALHAGVAALIAVLGVANFAKREQWGDPNGSGGGAVGVSAVKSIPMPGHEGPINRVANDTESQVPEPESKPQTKTKAAEKEPDDAVALNSKHTRKTSSSDSYSNPRTKQSPLSSNQLTSRVGQSASSPLFAQAPGSGGVGVGNGMPFGSRFGAYAALIRDRVAQKWHTDQVDSRIHSLPVAIVTFDIERNGEVRNVRVAQSSGNVSMDNSARRAVMEASPFEPLPAAYSGSSATIEFWFTLKR